MKAVICTKYGEPSVLQFKEVAKPEPKENEILVKVINSTVTAADYRIRGINVPFGFKFIMRLAMGFSKPRNPVLGSEFSGVVEKVGTAITAGIPQYATIPWIHLLFSDN